VLGEHVVEENENVEYNSDRRGYVRCRLTPDQWQTDFRVVPYIEEPGAPIRTDATFVVEDGTPWTPARRLNRPRGSRGSR
jgi:alkaline phosphatase D